MEQYSYKDIYAKNFLNEIKDKVRKNGIKLSGAKEKNTDRKMIEIIKEQNEDILKGLPKSNEEEHERIICTLILYYTALYYDNLSVLNNLLELGYDFGTNRNYLRLFALDKRISYRFSINTYYKLLKEQERVFRIFYDSLDKTDTANEEKETEIINTFSHILYMNPQVSFCNTGSNRWPFIEGLLTKQSIQAFGEKIILNATDKQKINIISRLPYDKIDQDSLSRLIYLMTTYGFSTDMYRSWTSGLNYFSDEELMKIDSFSSGRNLFYKHNIGGTNGADLAAIRDEINGKPVKNKKNNISKKRILSFFKKNQ